MNASALALAAIMLSWGNYNTVHNCGFKPNGRYHLVTRLLEHVESRKRYVLIIQGAMEVESINKVYEEYGYYACKFIDDYLTGKGNEELHFFDK